MATPAIALILAQIVDDERKKERDRQHLALAGATFLILQHISSQESVSRKRKRSEDLFFQELALQFTSIHYLTSLSYVFVDQREWWVVGRARQWFFDLILVGGNDAIFLEHFRMSR